MSDNVIHVERISKLYHIGKKQEKYKTFRDSLANALASPFRRAIKLFLGNASGASELNETIWALKDVSFDIKMGEVVGIIGRNGSGKSTLLKILSRISEPTSGFATIHGRIGSLLEVSTGFHPELTGRENIFLNGAILGMKKVEIDNKFDEIVAFSEVEKFIDTPVKHYSSGMNLRLAFAVAAHLETEILLVDEVLAVGDASFQRKCIGKMNTITQEGRTIIFVSHDMGVVSQLCEKAIWIADGKLKKYGITSDIVTAYLTSETTAKPIWESNGKNANTEVYITSAKILTTTNHYSAVFDFDSPFHIQIEYNVIESLKDLSIICRVNDCLGNIIWTSWETDKIGWKSGNLRDVGQYISTCTIPAHMLRPGMYQISIGARYDKKWLEIHERILTVQISEVGYKLNPERVGIITPILDWETKRINGTS